MSRLEAPALMVVCVALLIGCRQDMHDQPKLQPLEASSFFDNGMASRPIPEGTIPQGFLREDTHWWQGKDADGNLVDSLPAELELTRELLERGRDRYEIYCSVCHDSTGGGRGMIVRRGFKQPPPLYEQRLKDMPAGYFFDVMTAGFGLMSSYANQIPVADRWAIVAYVRALQLSQNSALNELPPEAQERFHEALGTGSSGEEPTGAVHSAEEHH
ncbi:MAG: cytochrome c [bacterium]|nr:cytochrome c [bacterium]